MDTPISGSKARCASPGAPSKFVIKLNQLAGVNILGGPSLHSRDQKPPLQALIVDDHLIVAQALSNLIKLGFGFQSRLASTTKAAQELISHQRFDIALLDLELADGHGLEVAENLSRAQPHCALIVVSGHINQLYCPAALRSKLTAVINKSQAFDQLSEVLRRVLLEARQDSGRHESLTALTAREADEYRLMGTGLSCKQIAAELGLTVRTVETHRKHIASKLSVSGAELVHRATLDLLLNESLDTGPDPNCR